MSTSATIRPAGGRMPGLFQAVARWASIVGHPFILTTALVLLTAGAGRLSSALEALSLTLVPCGLFVWWKVHTGAWQHIDVSDRRQRPALYALALALALALLWITKWNVRMRYLARGVDATIAILLLGFILNIRVKVSMHVAFCALVGTLALRVARPCGVGALAGVPLLCWARVYLGRHTWIEVLLGAALGLTTGVAAAWM